MTPFLSTKRSWYLAAMAVFLSTAASTLTAAFQARTSFHIGSRPSFLQSSTKLATSLSTSTGMNFTDFDGGEDNDNDGMAAVRYSNIKMPKEEKTPIRIHRMPNVDDRKGGRNSDFNEFHKYLYGISRRVKNGKTRANAMDDELKRLETKYYKLTGDNIPERRFEPNRHSYAGPHFQPDEKCYAMVINAYAKSGLGEEGARLAEATAERYEKHHPGSHANAFLLKGIVRSWINAGDLERAEGWLIEMENRYKNTHQPEDAPDRGTYTEFLEALAMPHRNSTKRAGDTSMQILHRMRDGFLNHGNPRAMPALSTYQAAMRCQALSFRGLSAANRTRKVLGKMEQDYEDYGRPSLCKPTAQAYLSLIEVSAKCRANRRAIMVAEDALEELQQRYERTRDQDYFPMEQMYVLILAAYGRMNSHDAERCSKKTDELLATMDKNGIAQSIYTVTAAIRAKVNDRSNESLEQAEEMMRTVEKPDARLYQSLIKGYCRNGNAEKADRVLAELEENFGSEVLSVAMCISTWSKSEGNEDRAIEKAESLLEKLVDKFQKGQVRSFHAPVDTWVLEDVARLWLRSRRPEAGDRIVALIETQKELHRFAPDYFAPTENLYVLAFDALTKTEVDADQKALALLNRFEHLAKEGALQPPTVRAYSSVICDLASSTNDKSLLKALELFETILQKIESGDSSGALSPMTVSLLFRTIFRSREKHAGEIALDILRRTVDVAKKQPSLITLNKTVFVNLLSGLSRRQLPDKAREAIEIMNDLAKEGYDTVPDAKAYTIVASSIASKKTPTTLQEAEDLQSKLMKLYEDGKLEADIRLWNSVLEVYKNVAHSREEASQLAYDLLMRLEEFGKSDDRLSPNLASYRSVCEALSKSKAPNSSAKSVALFCRAKELSQIGLISELDNSFYFAAISAHAKDKSDGGLDEASTLLEEMRNSEKQCLVPDYRTYNRILSAYAHSDQADKASRTAAILKQMEEDFAAGNESCQPSVHSYNSVILSAAYSNFVSSKETHDIFNLALENFKALHSQDQLPEPNSSTYEFFIRACLNLLPPGNIQTKLTSQAFSLCRTRGLVTPKVVGLCHCLLPGVKDELEHPQSPTFSTMGDMQAHDGHSTAKRDVEFIPEDWCWGVPEKKRSREVRLSDCRLHATQF